MKMHGKVLLAGSLATLLVTAGGAFAHGGSTHKSSERATNITFAATVKFQNGTTLPAGTYLMEVPGNTQTPTVTFSQDSKVVASAPVSVVSEPSKNPSTEVDTTQAGDAQNVTFIRPGGWKEALQFSSTDQ
jgi:hypothetical protein